MSKVFYDAIVIGGSAAGLSTSMALGRSLVKVLCIDNGLNCNRSVKGAHNFLGFDGISPKDLLSTGRQQVAKYPTVTFLDATVTDIKKANSCFNVSVDKGEVVQGSRIMFASGTEDDFSNLGIEGFYQFWGNSIIHCPFCHGYEHANKRTGLYHDDPLIIQRQIPLLYNWSKKMTLFTTPSAVEHLDGDFKEKINRLGVRIITNRIVKAIGEGTDLSKVELETGEQIELDVMYFEAPGTLKNKSIIEQLGVELDPQTNLIKVSPMQQTNVPEIFAAGDCTTKMRQISSAVAQGGIAGAMIVHDITTRAWEKL